MRLSRIVNRLTYRTREQYDQSCLATEHLRKSIPGWSTPLHHAFFEIVFSELPDDASVLVCGVYHGLDLALMRTAGWDARPSISVVGVDLFSSEPCDDWTDEQRAKGTWQANGFGEPPSLEAAQRNAPSANLVKASSTDFMYATDSKFDFVYLDTSHDYATLVREIYSSRMVLKPGGILAGDDYTGPENWGVQKACEELLPNHVAIGGRIWISP